MPVEIGDYFFPTERFDLQFSSTSKLTPMVASTACDSLCVNLENRESPQQLGLWELTL